jgi:hypothetical protein
MNILDFMKTKEGKIFTSIVLALGIACMLRISYQDTNMIIIKGPPIEQVEDKIFSFDSKCYSYKTVATSCKNLEKNNKSDKS